MQRFKNMRWMIAGIALGCAAMATLPSVMNPTLRADDTPATAPAKPKKAAKAPRVGNPYAKLDLTDEQKTQIAAIQKETTDEIKKLQATADAKIVDLLTDDQKAKLKEIQDAAAAAMKKPNKPKPAATQPATQPAQ